MEYSIQQLASLAGVTPRTLRHYHKIGLLIPARFTPAGYRVYTSHEADLLQQILFYRELGLPLAEITRIVQKPDFSPQKALESHLQNLRHKRDKLNALIQNAEKTLRYNKGEYKMDDVEKFAAFKQQMIDKNEEKYGEGLRQKYGAQTMDASNAKMLKMTQQEYDAFTQTGEELNETLRQAVKTGDPAGTLAQKAAALHQKWLQFTWPVYTAEAHLALAKGYVEDPRFTAYYEEIVPGGAEFLYNALAIYLKETK